MYRTYILGDSDMFSIRHIKKNRHGVLAIAGLLSVCLFGNPGHATPYLPSSDDEVLERLPTQANNADRQLRQMQRVLNNDPKNLALAIRTANALIEKARSDADPRYYGYAEAAVGYWWKQPQPPSAVLMLRATIRQHRHDFDGALADVHEVLAEEPRNAQAWLAQAVIQAVKGDYGQALNSCLILKRLSSRLVYASCAANAASLSGKAKPAYQLLKETMASTASTADVQEQLWALTILAEIAARLGDNGAAETHYLQALALKQRDVYLLSAYSDFLLDQNRPADVVTLLGGDTRPDGLLLRLALAEQALGSATLAQHVSELQVRMAAYRLRGDTMHQREEARITKQLLKQPEQALRLALHNWAVQREPWDARLVLETALAVDDVGAAKPVIDWLRRWHMEDNILQRLTAELELS
ncbi:MAG: hypothetical protein Q7U57_15780 [Methylovulum sp.]|nr:hypothetical protein [Methylovulum sp.]